MQKNKRRKTIKNAYPPADCYFCKNKSEPDYKQAEVLRRYMTERGKIVARSHSGICARHQRQLASEVKRARFLALVPFLARVSK